MYTCSVLKAPPHFHAPHGVNQISQIKMNNHWGQRNEIDFIYQEGNSNLDCLPHTTLVHMSDGGGGGGGGGVFFVLLV